MSKRISLYFLVLVAGVAVFLGLLVDNDIALKITRYQTRWVFLALYVFFFASGGLLVWARRSEVLSFIKMRWRPVLAAAAFVVFCGTFSLVHEEYNFKITADEYVLSLEAMSLHEEGMSQVPIRMHEMGGVLRSLGGTINKRPPAFVALLSFMHDVMGYRVENVFILNSVLVFAFYGLLFWVGRRFFGLSAAVFMCGLWATFPLFYQNANGAGFEILNLVFILLFIIAASAYWRNPSTEQQRFFVIVALLLANTRYESVLFVVAAGIVILARWWRSKRIEYDVSLYLAPLIMSTFLLRLKVFENDRRGNWQVADGQSPFSPEYFYDNIGHAMNHFLAFSESSTSSELLWVPGLAGLVFLLYLAIKKVLRGESLDLYLPFLCVAGVILANFLLLMFYHWGQLDYPEVSRLGLPLALLTSIGAAFLAFDVIRSRKAHAWAFVMLGAFAFLVTLPRAARAASSHSNFHVRRADWLIKQIRALPNTRYMVASNDAGRLFLDGLSAIPLGALNVRIAEAQYHHRIQTFRILVAQRFMVDRVTGKETVVDEDWLHPAFKLEAVEQSCFRPFVIVRLSRVVEIDAELAAKPASEFHKEKDANKNPRGGDVTPVTGEDVNEWLRNLP